MYDKGVFEYYLRKNFGYGPYISLTVFLDKFKNYMPVITAGPMARLCITRAFPTWKFVIDVK